MKKLLLILWCTLLAGSTMVAQPCNDPCELLGNCNFNDLDDGIYDTPPDFDKHKNAFSLGLVACWEASHGSPHIVKNFSNPSCPISGNAGACYEDYAYMWSDGSVGAGEGIMQDQVIQDNHKYFYTFKLRYAGPATNTVDNFYFKFINYDASFQNGVIPNGGAFAPIPTDEEIVRHVTSFNNTVTQTFCGPITADDDYMAVWLYPNQAFTHPYVAVEASDIHLYEVNAGNDITVCSGTTIQLGSGCAIPGATYSWTPTAGLITSTSANPLLTVSNTGSSNVTTSYVVSVTLCGVTLTDTVNITVTPNVVPTLSMTCDSYLCTNEVGNFSSGITSSMYDYNWLVLMGSVATPASPNTTITFALPGTYTVMLTVTDPVTGCFKTTTCEVHVTNAPRPPAVSTIAEYGCAGPFSYLITNYNSSFTYTVTVSGGTPINPTVSGSGNFTVNWTGSGGTVVVTASPPSPYTCSESTTLTVEPCCYDIADWVTIYPSNYDQASQLIILNGGVTTISNKIISVNGTLFIDATVTFNNCLFKMGPDARIEVLAHKTLEFANNSLLTVCTDPWDGIYLDYAVSYLIMDNTTCEHAKNAIVSIDGGKFTITNSYFRDNAIGIDVRNYTAGVHPGTVTGTHFYTSAPIITGSTFTGIKLYDVYNIQIGDPSLVLPHNKFYDLNYGITTGKSNYRIHNNEFSGIPGTCPFITTPNTGIYTLGYNSDLVIPNTLIEKNSFTRCENGIIHAFMHRATIKSNSFTRISQFGYYSYDRVSDASSPLLSVTYNDMRDVTNGVTIIEPSVVHTAMVQVDYNTIEETDRGIYFLNVDRPIATGNCITLNDPASVSVWNVGIHAESCVTMQAQLNSVQGSNSGSTTTGIRWDATTGTRVINNYIDGCFNSLTNLGDCSASTIKCNRMYNYTGAGYYQQGGPVGPQGSTSTSHYNKWDGSGAYKIANAYSDGTLSRFYVRSIAPYVVNAGESFLITPGLINPIPITIGLYSATDGCANDAPEFPCTPRSGVDGGSDGKRIMEEISEEEMQYTTNQLYEWNQRADVKKHPYEDYLQKDAIYKTYINHPESVSKEQLQHIPTAIIDVNTAAEKLQHIAHQDFPREDYTLASTPVDLPVANPNDSGATNALVWQQQLHTLITHTINRNAPYKFTAHEIAALETIANLCPVTHGRAVYEARAILQPIKNKNYASDCEQILNTSFRNAGNTEKNNAISIFPNPADASLTLQLANGVQTKCRVDIHNITGQLIYTSEVSSANGSITLNTSLFINGIYLVQVYNQNEVVHTQKITIKH